MYLDILKTVNIIDLNYSYETLGPGRGKPSILLGFFLKITRCQVHNFTIHKFRILQQPKTKQIGWCGIIIGKKNTTPPPPHHHHTGCDYILSHFQAA